ncbi:MAG: type II secretion system protein [Planctomycetota bacterium]|jgi:prepilin-type N-terminal cleavage/methylation domain-containing protein
MKIKRKNGFTLIELLVVISIIAMLLAILMPALNAVKKQAQRVVCMANQSQWGLILTLYTEDHDSRFFAGYYNYTDPNGVAHSSSNSDLWPYALESYYQIPKLMVCPSSRFDAPNIHNASQIEEDEGNLSGGYGLNGWLGNTPEEVLQTEGHDTANSWRTMDHSGGSKIPLMADANWYTGRPEAHDLPPKEQYNHRYDDLNETANEPSNHMQRFTVNRHKAKLNILFMDGMVKSISPKKLWRLKWHKNYDTSAPLPQWPEWMAPFEDPD